MEFTWADFIPVNYKYEYSVMFTLNVEEELENWERHEVGMTGDFRCGALLFMVIHVIYKYKNK